MKDVALFNENNTQYLISRHELLCKPAVTKVNRCEMIMYTVWPENSSGAQTNHSIFCTCETELMFSFCQLPVDAAWV